MGHSYVGSQTVNLTFEPENNSPPEAFQCLHIVQQKNTQDGDEVDNISLQRKLQGQSWWKWKYFVNATISKTTNEVETSGIYNSIMTLKVNLLQVATICQHLEEVKIITNLAENINKLNELLEDIIEVSFFGVFPLTECCQWINGASTIHLATRFHPESLFHFINKVKKTLVNLKTDGTEFSPLHVAASQSSAFSCSFLIKKNADVEVKTSNGFTPLHIAAMCGSSENVITLLYEGKANPLAQANDNSTPLHCSANSEIMNLLLQSGITINKILSLENQPKNADSLLDLIIRDHPASIDTYLGLMIFSLSGDNSDIKQQLVYDLSLFKSVRGKSTFNQLDKHLDLIKYKQSDYLNHPIMKMFCDMKWDNYRIRYIRNLLVFGIFLISFTFYGYYNVKLTRCKKGYETATHCYFAVSDLDWTVCPRKLACNIFSCEDFSWKNERNENVGLDDVIECLKEVNAESIQDLIDDLFFCKRIAQVLLLIITIWELFQLATKCMKCKPFEYFNLQNNIEILIIATTATTFILEHYNSQLCHHFLGWALFLSWWNLTLILGRFYMFGRNIYLAWNVMSDVAWSLVVYIPSFVAFACAFYCFLVSNELFDGFMASTVQILMMMVGELQLPKEGSFNSSFQVRS